MQAKYPNRLRRLREEAGLDPTEFCHRARLEPSTFRDLEEGRRFPYTHTRKRIQGVLDRARKKKDLPLEPAFPLTRPKARANA